MADESAVVDEHEQTLAVAKILREAEGYSLVRRIVVLRENAMRIADLHLSDDDQRNAINRLAEVLGLIHP